MHPYILERLAKDRLEVLREEAAADRLATTCRATARRPGVSSVWRVPLRRLIHRNTLPAGTR